jgi:hypothetical protein
MRFFVALPALTFALAACSTARPPTADARNPSEVPSVECHVDATSEPPGPALEAGCGADPACGCAKLGHALLMASDGAVEVHALQVLDQACRRGVVSSCNEVALVEELCVRGTARPSPACDQLGRDGRVGVAEMQAR